MQNVTTVGQVNNTSPLSSATPQETTQTNQAVNTADNNTLSATSLMGSPTNYATNQTGSLATNPTGQPTEATSDVADNFGQALQGAMKDFMQKILDIFMSLLQSITGGLKGQTKATELTNTSQQTQPAMEAQAAANDGGSIALGSGQGQATTPAAETPVGSANSSQPEGQTPVATTSTASPSRIQPSTDEGQLPPTTSGTENNTPNQTSTEDQPPATETTTIPGGSKGEWGDPHFNLKGTNGKSIHFDHKGIDGHTYNLFNGDGFQVDGQYVHFTRTSPQVVGEVRVTAGKDAVTYDKQGHTQLNGQSVQNGTYQLDNGSVLMVHGKQIELTSPEKDANIKIRAEAAGITVDPEGDFSGADGIIGTAVSENRKLSNEECNQFDVTQQRGI